MRLLLQRVKQSSVEVEQQIVGKINHGWLALLGISKKDSTEDSNYLIKKILSLRSFPDEQGKMNLDIQAANGSILLVSQFTLYGRCNKGNRPSFERAATPELAEELYKAFILELRASNLTVESGVFGAKMTIHMTGDGPVTILLDSKDKSNLSW